MFRGSIGADDGWITVGLVLRELQRKVNNQTKETKNVKNKF